MIKPLPSLSVACCYICMAEEQQPLPVSSKLNRRNRLQLVMEVLISTLELQIIAVEIVDTKV